MPTVLIMGANRGIGLEVVKQLSARGDRVLATYRSQPGPLQDLPGVELHGGVDVANRKSVAKLASTIGEGSLDQLMVVAGILEGVSLESFDPESVRRQFEVNALGPLQTVVTLLPCLKPDAKVGLLTSMMGSIDDNTSGGSYGYRMSKAALNMAGRSLAQDLRGRGTSVALLHPGWVRTEMTGGEGLLDAPESAAGLIARMDALTPETSGTFWHVNGKVLPW